MESKAKVTQMPKYTIDPQAEVKTELGRCDVFTGYVSVPFCEERVGQELLFELFRLWGQANPGILCQVEYVHLDWRLERLGEIRIFVPRLKLKLLWEEIDQRLEVNIAPEPKQLNATTERFDVSILDFRHGHEDEIQAMQEFAQKLARRYLALIADQIGQAYGKLEEFMMNDAASLGKKAEAE